MDRQEIGKVILRIGLSLVFLWFSFQQLSNPILWVSFVPGFVSYFVSPVSAVIMNGFAEMILGLLLIFGMYTRISSLLLGLHLLGIAFSVGFNPVGIRDFGLGFACMALSFLAPDKYCLDKKF